MQASLEAITTNKQAADDITVTRLNEQISTLVEENSQLKMECERNKKV